MSVPNSTALPMIRGASPQRAFFGRPMSEILEDPNERMSACLSGELHEPEARVRVVQDKREETLEAAAVVAEDRKSSTSGQGAEDKVEQPAELPDETLNQMADAMDYLLATFQDCVSLRIDVCRCLQKYSGSTRSGTALEELENYFARKSDLLKEFKARYNLICARYDMQTNAIQLTFLNEVYSKFKRLHSEVVQHLIACAKRLFSICMADIMDESLSRFLTLCQKNRDTLNHEVLLDTMKTFMFEKSDSNTLRESVQSLHGEAFQTVCERYHTLLAKLKRHKSITLTLVQSMEVHLEDFEYVLRNSIPNGVSSDHLIAGEPALVNISVIQHPYKRDLKTQNEDDRPGNKSFADFGPSISPAVTVDDGSRYFAGFDKKSLQDVSYNESPEQTRKNSTSQRPNHHGIQGQLFSNSHSTGKLHISAMPALTKATTNMDPAPPPNKLMSHLGPVRPTQDNSEDRKSTR